MWPPACAWCATAPPPQGDAGDECPADLPPLMVDERALRQVLLHLLSNAVKFTAAGGRITVSAARAADGFRMSVQEHGIGISAENRDVVFEAFRQLDGGFAAISKAPASACRSPRPGDAPRRPPGAREHGRRRQHFHTSSCAEPA